MLQLYDKNHVKIQGLTKYKDYNIESTLSSGDKVLSFVYPTLDSDNIQEEGYIRTKTAEFVIKSIEGTADWKTIKASLNVEDLEGKPWDRFDSTEQTITDCLNLALAGTGWIIGICNISKKRTVRKTGCSSWDIVQEAIKTYRVEVDFDTLNKVINIYDKIGSDKGAYFIDSLNLKELTTQSNSYSYYTRIQAVGKDGLTLADPGYVENYQYSNKIKTLYWKDERYADVTSLTEDAALKLDEISKPYRAYGADIIDLANCNDKYKNILSYCLGDTITIISMDLKIKEKQRIAKITQYPEEPERNTCELANVILSFEDVQKENQETTDTVNNITEDDGTVSQSAVSTAVNNLTANKADIGDLNAVTARVGELETTTAHITDGIIDNATINIADVNNLSTNYARIVDGIIDNAKINVADVNDLNANYAHIAEGVIDNAKIDVSNINNLYNNYAHITKGVIDNASIGSLDASVIDNGVLNTDLVSVGATDGRMVIHNNKIQIFEYPEHDSGQQLFERICIGNINGDDSDYGIIIRALDGTTSLINSNGITKEGFTDGYNKLDDDSLDAAKIDIETVISKINSDDNTVTIDSSKIYMNEESLTSKISSMVASLGEQSGLITSIESEIQQLANGVNVTITNVKGDVENNSETLAEIKEYFTFDITGMGIKTSENALNVHLSQTELDFKNGDDIIAYISGTKLYIDQAEILTSFDIGLHRIEKYNDSITTIKFVG